MAQISQWRGRANFLLLSLKDVQTAVYFLVFFFMKKVKSLMVDSWVS